MPDLDRRVVPDPPPGRVQAPDEIHVLAEAERGIEDAGLPLDIRQRGSSDHQGGGRDVRNPPVRLDPRLAAAEIERSAGRAVMARGRRRRNNPRRDGRNERIDEVCGQCIDPARRRDAVAVEKGHELAGDSRQPGVARGGRSPVLRASHDECRVPCCHSGHGGGVGRPVVDHHHVVLTTECGEALIEHRRAVADRDQDGHLQ